MDFGQRNKRIIRRLGHRGGGGHFRSIPAGPTAGFLETSQFSRKKEVSVAPRGGEHLKQWCGRGPHAALLPDLLRLRTSTLEGGVFDANEGHISGWEGVFSFSFEPLEVTK